MCNVNPEEHLGLCHMVARRWVTKGKEVGFEYDDLVQICNLVLFTRYKYFDQRNGAKFSTYICKAMNQELWKTLIRDNKFYPGRGKDRVQGNVEMLSLDFKVNGENGEGTYIDTVYSCDNYDFIEKESYEELVNKINHLPQDLKQIVSYKLQGLGQSEIAKIIGISQAHVSRKLTKVKQVLLEGKEVTGLRFAR